MIAVDLFCGAGGWKQGAKRIGIRTVGVEVAPTAVATARAAGHDVVEGDVSMLDPAAVVPDAHGLIASPPCPGFSRGGLGAGRQDLSRLVLDVEEVLQTRTIAPTGWRDPLSPLVLEPARWIAELSPLWIALEQVPPVLPVWEALGRALEARGWRVVVGVVNAADYGVPQIRKRAVLLAHRAQPVALPAPTHAENAALFLPQWRTMHDELGWGFTDRPAPTLPATSAGGPRVLDGGSGARAALLRAYEGGKFVAPPTGITRTGAVRVDVSDAGRLQTFPGDYPWQGRTLAEKHRQIGNAVPPLLSEHLLRAVTA